MTQTRYYSSVAPQTSLAAGIGPSDTSCSLLSTTGLPGSFPFTLALDYQGATEELVDVTNLSGTTATIVRAVDGTSASSHASGAFVRHVSSARDFTEANIHENATSGVHGITGHFVGDTDTQTLTNKTLTTPTINGAALSGTLSGNPTFSGSPSVTGSTALNGGGTWTGTLTGTGNLVVNGSAIGTVQSVVNGPSGQTANIEEWRVNGTAVASVSSAGKFSGSSVAVTNAGPANSVAINSTQFVINSGGDISVAPTDTGTTPALSVTAFASTGIGKSLIQLTRSTGQNAFLVNNGGATLLDISNINVSEPAGLSISTTLANAGVDFINCYTLGSGSNKAFQVDGTGALTAVNFTSANQTYTPSISGGALVLGNGVLTGNYSVSGNQVTVQIQIVCGTTTTLAASGNLIFSAPVSTQHSGTVAVGTGYFTKTSGGSFFGASCVLGAGSSNITYFCTSGTTLNSFNTTGSNAAVANGSVITVQLTYLI